MDAPRTLYEDWLLRRDELLKRGAGHDAPLRVLEYLLHRYQNTPEATLPAKFPTTGQVVYDRRAIVVHRSMGRVRGPGIQTEEQAHDRCSGLLKKMAALEVAKDVKPPGGWIAGPDLWDALKAATLPAGIFLGIFSLCILTVSGIAAITIYSPSPIWAFPFTFIVVGLCVYLDKHRQMWHERALSDARNALQRGEPLSNWSIRQLVRRIHWKGAMELLDQIADPRAVQACVDRWIDQPSERGHFERYMLNPIRRELVAEAVRKHLASNDPILRIRAIRMIARIGSLDDVGLLIDLATIAYKEHDGATEREALLAAALELAGSQPTAVPAAPAPETQPAMP